MSKIRVRTLEKDINIPFEDGDEQRESYVSEALENEKLVREYDDKIKPLTKKKNATSVKK